METGPDQQQIRVGIETVERGRVPRVGRVARRFGGRKVSGGERHSVGLVEPAAGGLDGVSGIAAMQGHGFVGDEVEPLAALGGADFAGEDALHIGTVEPARHEGEPVLGDADDRALLLGQRPDPVEKMIGPVGEGAHVAGPHVQQVMGIAGPIGEAAPELRVALDEIDAVAGARAAQQMHREQRAAEPGADDGDAPADLLCHVSRPPLGNKKPAQRGWRGPIV